MGPQLPLITWLLLWLGIAPGYSQPSDYELKDLQLRAPTDYSAHQSFQNLAIGAYPCNRPDLILEIFDTDRLWDKGFFPVLLVMENQNDFPVQVSSKDIYLVDSAGGFQPAVPFLDVLLDSYLDKPASSYSLKKEILIEQFVDPKALIDFKQKSFTAMQVEPGNQIYGVVFFPLPENGDISGFRLYFPRIVNVTTKEPLVFFEFELVRNTP